MNDVSETLVVDSESVESTVFEEAKPVESKEEAKPKSTFLNFDDPASLTPDNVKGRVGELTRKQHEAEAEAKKEREKNQQLQQELRELKKPREVQAPSADDALDDPEKFQKQQQAREEYLRKQAEFDSETQRLEGDAERKAREAQAEKTAAFNQKAANSGIDLAKVDQASDLVAGVIGSSPHVNLLAEELLGHDKAPELIVHLAENPMKLYEIARASPFDAARKMDAIVKTLTQSNTVLDPPDDLKGGTIDISGDDFIAEME